MRKLTMSELNRLNVEQFKGAPKTPITIVLDSIRSLYNVGSVFRTADAFRIEQIIICGITATPPHREIEKTALGATKSVSWTYFENSLDAIKKLKKEHYKVVAVEQVEKSLPLTSFYPEKDQKIALIFGNEVKGVSDEVLKNVDCCIEIPQFGTKHSLNVAVSAGIVIWDLYTKSIEK